jgi:penicillin-binding protein 1A
MAVRRTKPRSNRKPPQQSLPDGDDGPARFADTSEIQFDFSSERPASPKRAIQRASRPTAPPSDSRTTPAEEVPRVDITAAAESLRASRDEGDGDGADAPEASTAAPQAPAVGENGESDRRRARISREVPAPPRPKTGGGNGRDGGGGNGKPPTVTLPPPPAPPVSPPPRNRPRLKKLRMLFVLAGLAFLAMVSTVFGMMMAVSQDLPEIETFAQFKAEKNSVLLDDTGASLGTLTSNENRIVLTSGQISQNVKSAVVAIEDKRFYEHGGVDFQGIARALVEDVLHQGATQGASTITEQFVKNALDAQGSRTVFEKLREAALAYHLEKKWSKDKILTEYLNTIYFGEGAYGIESAARTYFGWAHPGCGSSSESCASVLLPGEAATLAGIISSPSAYDPKLHPLAAKERRDEVLQNMLDQGLITQTDYDTAIRTAMPAPSQIHPPTIDSKSPYFTTWLRQQLVDKYGPGKAFFGGLKVHTTLDLGLQDAVQNSISNRLGAIAPTGSAVVLNNKTGAVKAMVGGPGYSTQQFNIATQGARQPGSSWKLFDLVSALKLGHSPSEVWSSQPKTFYFGKHHKQTFVVHNDENNYSGSLSLTSATEYSDNSVFADLSLHLLKGFQKSTRYIARTAHEMGITSPVSINPAMVIGGLKQGVNPLEMAHAYSTLATNGKRVSGTLAANPGDPVAYTKVEDDNNHVIKDGQNKLVENQVIPASVAETAKGMLGYVVSGGTGVNAQVSGYTVWGKTGTTENNGDAWFCGTIEDMTACVWVGHADSVTPMTTDYNGGPVMGGTYPALIWHDIAEAWLSYKQNIAAIKAARKAGNSSGSSSSTSSSGYSTTPSYSAPAPAAPAPTTGGGGGGGGNSAAPATAAPAAPAPAAPAPSSPAPSSGSLPTGGAGPAG